MTTAFPTRLTAAALAILTLGLASLSAPVQAQDNRTQLERVIRIAPEDAGRFTNGQLTAIFHIQNDSSLNDNTRKRRIEAIKGRSNRSPGGSRLF